MKRFFLSWLTFSLTLLPTIAGPGPKWNQTFQNYFDKYKDIAIAEMLKYGIPASITLAQAVLESAAGQSELSQKGNNHFGIKCHGWDGRTVYHDDDFRGECFRAYDSVIESYEDHSRFLRNRPRYNSLFSLATTDYRGWAHGLKRAGYATNPAYAQRLIDIIELYKLYQYDIMTGTSRPIDLSQAQNKKIGTTPRMDRSQMVGPAHTIRRYNENYYIVARAGDTFETIGKEVGVSYRKLAQYNERDRNDILSEGEFIWLKKKQHQAPQDRSRFHRVQNAESLYDISQSYGIQLRYLIAMNRDLAARGVKVGDQVRLY
ncbi:hypothetical protein HMPREF9140_00298 [Prevotella micans F0438]|uniref:LysM domain-containing protein n=1 Tax=Prevotella micans F0438 TaxID=883158 RepID=H1Q060_9BACT|nr:glucosaminidase domain-containing protein [Prevotella micans]EHO74137.1 hypothetical protein HMPREF9140_00298 [Prevotella micans F0438]